MKAREPQKILDSSFLDGKLQNALSKSYVVQSQLKYSVYKEDAASNRTRAGRSRRSNTIERMVDRPAVVMGKLLLETGIKSAVKGLLGGHYEKALEMLITKLIRMRPMIPEKSMSLDEQGTANVYKETVLYSATKAASSEDSLLLSIPDLTDLDKLRGEIIDLETQHARLTKDLTRSKIFLYHSRTSDSMMYYYYAERLHHARRCQEQSKIRSMSGNYLSKMFDMKCQQMKVVEDMLNNLTIANSIIQSIGFNLTAEVRQIASTLQSIDLTEYQRVEADMDIQFNGRMHALYEKEYEKLKALDERIYKITQTVKYIHNISSSVEHNKTMNLNILKHHKESKETVPAVNYEELYSKESISNQKYMKNIHKDLADCMERCYAMASKRAHNKAIAMQAVLGGRYLSGSKEVGDQGYADSANQRIKEAAEDMLMECNRRNDLTAHEVTVNQAIRENIFAQHTEKLNSIQELLNQQRNSYMSQMKARMGSLYNTTQSRSKRHSFTFSNFNS